MKKFLTFIAFFAAMAISSCSHDDLFGGVFNGNSEQTNTLNIVFDIKDGTACMAGTSLEFGYTIKGGYKDASIECYGDGGWRTSLTKSSATKGRIKVTAPEMGGDGKIVVLVVSNSGGTCMKSILFDEGKIENIVDSYEVDWAANTLNVEFRTNLDYDVRIPAEAQSWISVAETRATMRDAYITLAISENPEGEPARAAIVELVNELGDILYSFEVNQQPQPSGEAIVFADQSAKLVCVQKFDTNGDGELSPKEAAVVTELGGNFFGDYSLAVRSFDELQYFINLNDISYKAFYGCNNLKGITIPYGITSIGDGAFSHCDSLTSVTIPDSVTTIRGGAFEDCSSLTSVTIPDSVTSIGDSAFSNCSSLTSVTIPDSVTSIGDSAFSNCSSLTSVTIGNSVTTIGEKTFAYCCSLTSVTIPNSVTTIGYGAFADCSSLTSITIPDSVTTIGITAFYNCSSLTSVTIPKNLTKIESNTFYGCSSLENIYLPEGLISIGDEAFAECDNLTIVTIPSSVVSFGVNPFCGCDNIKEFKGNFTTNDGKALIFYDKFISFACKCSATEYLIPDSVTTIVDSAFESCSSLTSVTIPNSVTKIECDAFRDCSSLTSIYCKATTPPAGSDRMFDGNASGRKIYVPTESVEAYKSASYWSDYADAIEGYNF